MNSLIKSLDMIVRATHNIAAALLAAAVILVFYQVLTRFLLGQPAVWSEVTARAVIVWGVFLIMGPALRHGVMIPIDIFRSLFPEDRQIWIVRIVALCVTIFLLIFMWFGFKMTLRVIHQQVAMLNISVAWLYSAMPVGALLALPGLILAQIDAESDHRKLVGVSR